MNAHVRHPPGKYRLTIEDYLFLDRSGAFQGSETELVNGDVIVMSPEWRPHFRIKSELLFLLRQAVEQAGLPYFVGSEGSIALSETDMPRPDIVLTDDPSGEGAIPLRSVPLVVEVSSSTLDDDLEVKAQRYARSGIPEYWVVDVNGRIIHQMWTPSDAGYVERRAVSFDRSISATVVPTLTIPTASL